MKSANRGSGLNGRSRMSGISGTDPAISIESLLQTIHNECHRRTDQLSHIPLNGGFAPILAFNSMILFLQITEHCGRTLYVLKENRKQRRYSNSRCGDPG